MTTAAHPPCEPCTRPGPGRTVHKTRYIAAAAEVSRSVGKILTGHIDRYHGPYVLRSEADLRSKVRTWRVEEWSG